ncbi:unnamed protein product [Tuber melanosporum]|uniref:(Perigord truffle) hypothetical protein n=1 Tax=Tuber melanosporum (strain Mel28) TaxID=656061 RepID=D5G642_TUBMM|nr:uncharacterized protein GSTUM_00001761001 [Tuber melanosporum]CAZ79985.1 unnamed protein product [Tuber melanosporum]
MKLVGLIRGPFSSHEGAIARYHSLSPYGTRHILPPKLSLLAPSPSCRPGRGRTSSFGSFS